MLEGDKEAANQFDLSSAAKTERHNVSQWVVCIILKTVLNPGILEGVPRCGPPLPLRVCAIAVRSWWEEVSELLYGDDSPQGLRYEDLRLVWLVKDFG